MLFADASAIIALVATEAEAMAMAACLERHDIRLYSGIAAWEAVAGLCRHHAFSPQDARVIVNEFLMEFGFRCVTIGEAEYATAIDAYARFGKGRHPAALNMGDCFAYACAKVNHAHLLFKGNDFSKTDIALALDR